MDLGPLVAASGTGSASALGLQDFLRVLLTQLTWQDPLKPMDNQAFLAQLAQFATLQQGQASNERLDRLLANHAALQSVGLLGRSVEVQGAQGRLAGTVSALQLEGQQPVFSLTAADGRVWPGLRLDQLLSVR